MGNAEVKDKAPAPGLIPEVDLHIAAPLTCASASLLVKHLSLCLSLPVSLGLVPLIVNISLSLEAPVFWGPLWNEKLRNLDGGTTLEPCPCGAAILRALTTCAIARLDGHRVRQGARPM